jgi:excinuclease ABC subunit A
LLTVLHRLRDHGNTVVVIEHNLDVIKTADWIVDLGPEGGAGGGQIIAQGTPVAITAVEESYTGRYLKPVLAPAVTADDSRVERRASIRGARARKASSDLLG